MVNNSDSSVDGAGGSGIIGLELAVLGAQVSEAGNFVQGVPHVAVVGVVVVVGVSLGARSGVDLAVGTDLGQFEDLVVDVPVNGGGAS